MTMPSIEQAREAFREAEKEYDYWMEHAEEHLAKYRERFIAVKDGNVIADAEDLAGLVRALEEHNVDIGDAWIRYVTDDYTKYLL